MRMMGIDYGSKKVGVAISDEGGTFAFPRSVLAQDERLLQALLNLIHDEKVKCVVMGESKNYAGEANPIGISAAQFAKELGAASGVEVVFESEVLSSKEAERIQGKHELTDASAAAIILQSYIERTRHGTRR